MAAATINTSPLAGATGSMGVLMTFFDYEGGARLSDPTEPTGGGTAFGATLGGYSLVFSGVGLVRSAVTGGFSITSGLITGFTFSQGGTILVTAGGLSFNALDFWVLQREMHNGDSGVRGLAAAAFSGMWESTESYRYIGGVGPDFMIGSNGADTFEFVGAGDVVASIVGDDIVGVDGDILGIDTGIGLDRIVFQGNSRPTYINDPDGVVFDVQNTMPAVVDLSLLGAGVDVEITTGFGATVIATGFQDRLVGNAGSDVLFGGEDSDQLWGYAGLNQLYGGGGVDFLHGDWGGGIDTLYGGDGVDTYYVDNGDFIDRFAEDDARILIYTTKLASNTTLTFEDGVLTVEMFSDDYMDSEIVAVINGVDPRLLSVRQFAGAIEINQAPPPFYQWAIDAYDTYNRFFEVTAPRWKGLSDEVWSSLKDEAIEKLGEPGTRIAAQFLVNRYSLQASANFAQNVGRLFGPAYNTFQFVTDFFPIWGNDGIYQKYTAGKYEHDTALLVEDIGLAFANFFPFGKVLAKLGQNVVADLIDAWFEFDVATMRNNVLNDLNTALARAQLGQAMPATAGSDVGIGTSNADSMSGEGGNDTWWAGELLPPTPPGPVPAPGVSGGPARTAPPATDGDDTFDGGADRDMVIYAGDTTGIVVDLALGTATGAEIGSDTLISIEDVVGGSGADTLLGNDVANFLDGEGAADSIDGRGGDDTLAGGAGDDSLIGGTGNDTLTGGAGNDTMDGGDGADLFVFSTEATGADRIDGFVVGTDRIDVRAFGYTSLADITAAGGGIAQDGSDVIVTLLIGISPVTVRIVGTTVGALTAASFVFANPASNGNDTIVGTEIDDVLFGGAANDDLSGDDGNDTIYGGSGIDNLKGDAGDDVLIDNGAPTGGYNLLQGGDGIDTVSFAWTSSAVYADIASTGGHVDGVLTAIMSGIENLLGGGGADVLVGDGGVNRLNGGSGNSDDLLFGGGGNDVFIGGGHALASFNQLWGGDGTDVADYSAETSRVFVDLRAPAGHLDAGGGFVLNDLMNSVENVLGGFNNDILIGTDEANSLSGGNGYDLLFGFGGDDILNGGEGGAGTYNQLWGDTGSDTASYEFATTRVYADLRVVAGWVTDGGGTLVLNDVYNSVENFIGGSVADSLVGDDNANRLTGGGGADLLYGFGGSDTFVYRAASESNLTTGYDSIADFESGSDKLDLTAFGITAGDVLIAAAGGFTSAVYANTDGVAGYDLALVVTGTTASIQVSDLLLAI